MTTFTKDGLTRRLHQISDPWAVYLEKRDWPVGAWAMKVMLVEEWEEWKQGAERKVVE